MRLLTFQSEAVDRLRAFLARLGEAKKTKSAFACQQAWDQLVTRLGTKKYSPLIDASKDEVPCLSVVIPTGGGKTVTAMGCALEALKARACQDNLIVWIVPSEAIFRQTKEYLTKGYLREFVRGAGFDDVVLKLNQDSWCDLDLGPRVLTVVLLTQQSIFSDNADRLFSRPSDLFIALSARSTNGRDVTSLKDLLAALKPVFVVDEAHKTYTRTGREFFRKNSLAWCLLEFSATPKQYSEDEYPNVIYSAKAERLIEEQLLKNPLNVRLEPTRSVETILQEVIVLRAKLESGLEAEGYLAKPKVLISCYRTSEYQAAERNSAHQIRDLLISRGVESHRIAFKTSEKDDIKDMSVDDDSCPFEFILTKQALVEGWDAKSVYVIVLVNEIGASLTNFQIVGRGLRQPRRQYFRDPELNALTVYASGVRQGAALEALRGFISGEGLDDALMISGVPASPSRIECKLQGAFSAPFLQLDVEREWFDAMAASSMSASLPPYVSLADIRMHFDANASGKAVLGLDGTGYEHVVSSSDSVEEAPSTYCWAAHFIAYLVKDIAPYFFEAKDSISWAKDQFSALGPETNLGWLLEQDPQGAAAFVAGHVREQFAVRRSAAFLGALDSARLGQWHFDSTKCRLMADKSAQTHKRFINSVIGDIPKTLFNKQELQFAYDLDDGGYHWLRNNPAEGWYYLPGGMTGRFYPDFIVLGGEKMNGEYQAVVLIETKGGHLLTSLDSEEKRKASEEVTRLSRGKINVIFDGFDQAMQRLKELNIK